MKKIIFLIISVIMLSALPLCINAGSDYIIPNPPVTVEITSPTVDGNITKTEGWSEPVYMNEDTMEYLSKNRPLNIFGEVYFALDWHGFYLAADIKENVSAYAPDSNPPAIGVPMTAGLVYADDKIGNGQNGDCFSIGIDVLDIMRTNPGVDVGERYTVGPNYSVYIYKDGSFRVYGFDDNGNVTDITEHVVIEGKAIDEGWCFEIWIPWQEIVCDIEYLTLNKSKPEIEDILSDGAIVRVGTEYYDRWILSESGVAVLYNRYYTAEEYAEDNQWNFGVKRPEHLGIELNVSNTCKNSAAHRWSDWITVSEPTYFEKGEQMSVCRVCGEVKYRTLPVKEYRNAFSDVKETSWYAKGVEYCVKRGYLSGMGNEKFSPNTALTREQCVVLLANILDADTTAYLGVPSGFEDVPLTHWYSSAVAWAVDMGYVKGMSENTFGTGLKIQRAAFARLIYFAARDLGADMTVRADLTEYVDHDKLPQWAYEQISWAVGNNIIISIKDDVLMVSPYTELKRAQCATMIWQMGLMLEEQK
ncbi:MAG: S-layer homology domain-containing protein [Clostridia bacterium]|nr:S-layer homology domain-containing protein [Clostridia bacterium]